MPTEVWGDRQPSYSTETSNSVQEMEIQHLNNPQFRQGVLLNSMDDIIN